MNITKLSLKRPVGTVMFYTAVLLLGFISMCKTPKALLPKINYPRLTISTKYLSAAPAETESLITIPLEETISTVPGIKNISSVSKEGISVIYADFAWETNVNRAILDIRQKIDRIREKLPQDASPPLIKKMNPFSRPMLEISFASDKDSEKTLFYINKLIKDKISKTPGVALVKLSGIKEKNIFIDIDADRLKAYNLDTKSICKSLKETNLNYPAGNAKSDYYDYVVRTEGRFNNLRDIEDTLISINQSHEHKKSLLGSIKIKNIARVYEDYPETTNISRLNQKPVITLSVYKQSDANTINTARQVLKNLDELDILKQKNIEYTTTYNKAVFIQEAVSSTKTSAFLGALLAFLTLLFFLRSAMSAGIVFLSIPVSLFACFIFMFFGNITFNLISLSGLALSIGMLVDNAVVVIESIKRKTDTATHSKKNISDATAKVTFSLIASTLTTICVFMPLLFLKGLAGALFGSLAAVVTCTLIVSLVVSVTLIPRLYLNVKRVKTDKHLEKYKPYTDALTLKYKNALRTTLDNPKKILCRTAILFFISIILFYFMPKEIMPKMNEENFMLKIDMPPASNISHTDDQVKKIEELLLSEKKIESVSVKIGSDQSQDHSLMDLSAAQAEITVKTKKLSDKSFEKLLAKIEKLRFTNTEISCTRISPMQDIAAKDFALKVVLNSFSNQTELIKTAKKINNILKTNPLIYKIENDTPKLSPENNVKLNKQKAALRGVSADYISAAIYTALKGTVATFLTREDKKIPIIVRLSETDRSDMKKIKHLPLKITDDDTVFLKDVASFEKGFSPSLIRRKNGLKEIELKLHLAKGVSLNTGFKKIQKTLEQIAVSKNIDIKMSSANAENKDAFLSLTFMFILALFLIYMIMSAQFESFINPLLIMLTVPLSVIGVAFGLFLFAKTLNIISILGIIMLCGITVNNGIILIEYIEQNIKSDKHQETSDIKDAIVDACVLRFRPIIITASTTILGLLPMMLTVSDKSAIKSTLAVTLSFGLFTGALLTLFILPLAYLEKEKRKKQKTP